MLIYQAMDKYYKSYMKSTLNIWIYIVCLLAVVQANDPNSGSGYNDTAPFQPIDLTELLKSLNITYQDILPNSKNDPAPQQDQNKSYISTKTEDTNNATQSTQINSAKNGPSNQNIELQTTNISQLKSAKEQVIKATPNETKSILAEQKNNKSQLASNNQSFEQIPTINTKAQAQKTNTGQLPLNSYVLFPNLPLLPKKNAVDSFQNYQYQIRESNAIYNITASYKVFTNYFIITKTDEYLPQIKDYLMDNYGNYLSDGQIIAGFKMYNYYGDSCIDYQLLYNTMYGIFIAILTYWPDNNHILLKSLSVINFYIMQIDYSNCFQINQERQNCNICNKGYRNFMGRCQLIDSACSQYVTDECGRCSEGKVLSYGHCQ